jgi:hypothetical protein
VGTGQSFTFCILLGSVATPSDDITKERLISAPILGHPDFAKPFILDTDASKNAIGAVLSQEIDGAETVIAYGSRTLTKTERKYCVTGQSFTFCILLGSVATPSDDIT